MTRRLVSELEGAELDAAVALADGVTVWMEPDAYHDRRLVCDGGVGDHGRLPAIPYSPSTDWSLAGPIIERERISVRFQEFGRGQQAIAASIEYPPPARADTPAPLGCGWWLGDTPLQAAMRAFVASRFGDSVDIP